MQCKDIPDRPILEFLTKWEGDWCHWFPPGDLLDADFRGRSVLHAMPDGTTERLARAKMIRLIRRKLVDGCTCGCRGDYEITEKGIMSLRETAETTLPSGIVVIDRRLPA